MDADILIGIPSRNEEQTIGFVTEQVDRGLTANFPQLRSLIVNIDNGSDDRTPEVFEEVSTSAPRMCLTTESPGKGGNVLRFLDLVNGAKPRAAAIVDADLESIKPDWIRNLLDPILRRDAEFVSPDYRTSQGGPLRALVSYPLIRGIFQADIPQPTGGEFAFTPDVARRVTSQDLPPSAKSYGIDLFLSTEAATGGFTRAVASLGEKIHHRRPWHTIGFIVEQVLRTGMYQVGKYAARLGPGADPVIARPSQPMAGQRPAARPRALPADPAMLAAEFSRRLRQDEKSRAHVLHPVAPVLSKRGITDEEWAWSLVRLIRYSMANPADLAACAKVGTTLAMGRMIDYERALRSSAPGEDLLLRQAGLVESAWRQTSCLSH